MKMFLHGHATHPDARVALALATAQVEAQRQQRKNDAAPCTPTLGWVYLTDHFAPQAEGLLADLRRSWPDVAWVGATGVGIAAGGVEYFDEPAVALMLCELPRAQFRVFSGAQPLAGFAPHTAQVHGDPATDDLPELIHEMSARTATGYVFGGLASSRTRMLHIADGVLTGGLSGVAFGVDVALVSRVTQGCQPVGPLRRVTGAQRNVITTLDGEPALDCLLRDLNLEGVAPRAALPRLQQILVGLNDAPADASAHAPANAPAHASARASSDASAHPPAVSLHETPADDADTPSAVRRHAFDSLTRRSATVRAFGADTRVRDLIGLDPGRRGIAIADLATPGMQLAFCTRDADAARRDLTRICAEVREEVEPGGIAGAVYVSCSGRGGPHFGAPSAELAIVRHALGDVPLVGFFAAGEIAHRHLYGYTGVLTVFPRGA